jgi:hypothetical protein
VSDQALATHARTHRALPAVDNAGRAGGVRDRPGATIVYAKYLQVHVVTTLLRE